MIDSTVDITDESEIVTDAPIASPTEDNVQEEEEEEADEPITPRCSPGGSLYRFAGLLFMCLLGFGSYFCYDGPGALQDNFQADLDLSTSRFVLLYSWYSWPNVILCFVGGFLIDRVFGIRLGTCIYASLVVLGQIIFAAGGLLDAFWLMVVGRFIFGIGGESLAVAQNSYAVLWFKGKELNMVFGLQLSFARLGSTVNFLVMETIYQWVNQYYKGYTCTGVTLLIAGTTTLMSLGCALVLAYMDKKVEVSSNRRNAHNGGEVVKLTDVKDFPANFWMVCIVCISYYVAIFPFIALGKVFFERKYDMNADDANRVNSMVYIISAVASPLLGYIVDLSGRNVFWVLISVIISIGAHGLLAFTFVNPYVGMCILGFAYSMLASALWPMIALVIPEFQLGTAYGIAQSIQNLGLAIITMFAGMIVDDKGYVVLEVFFLVWLCVALIAVVAIWMYDAITHGILNMSVQQREIYEREKLVAERLEREKLVASGSLSAVTPQDLLQPRSDFHIRNRYLSRIGARMPSHFVGGRPRGASFRALR